MSLYIRKDYQNLQAAIDTGSIWMMEGSAGRWAMQSIENGEVVLGPKPSRDYWGNYVPSRYEIKPGTKGSIGYARAIRLQRAESDW